MISTKIVCLFTIFLVFFAKNPFKKDDTSYSNLHSLKFRDGLSIKPDTDIFRSLFSARYIVEEHTITTDDGYILQVFRVNLIDSEKEKLALEYKKNIGKVVLLQHGLFCSADALFLTGEDTSVGFHVVNRGFDLWLGNERGNIYSLRHTDKKIKYKDFFDYSFDEVALYDIPAVYKYVLATTKQEKLTFFGYSLGTTQFFAAAIDDKTRDYITSKTEKFIAIAPTIYLNHVTSVRFRFLAYFRNSYIWLFNLFNIHQVMHNGLLDKPFVVKMTNMICDNFTSLCTNFIPAMKTNLEYDTILDDVEKTLTHHPAGTSARNVFHYMQQANLSVERKFQQYDHGVDGNMKKYGQPEAPYWEISKFQVETVFILGEKDLVVNEKDVKNQIHDMKNCSIKALSVNGYNHLTFSFPKKSEGLKKVLDQALE